MYARIRALREDADLKQKELAAMLNLHQTTYSDYELGRLNVPAPVLIQLSSWRSFTTPACNIFWA